MENLEENQSCYNCECSGSVQELPCRIHFICTQCLEENTRDETELKNLFCKCLAASTSQEPSVPNEGPDNRNESIPTVPSVKYCTVCNVELPDAIVQYCRNCTVVLCFNCSIHHKIDIGSCMHVISPFSSESKPHCPVHNRRADYFCSNQGCKKLACKTCVNYGHEDHQLCSIERKSEIDQDAALRMFTFNEEEYVRIGFRIFNLNNKRNEMRETFEYLEIDLQKRRNYILRVVREEFDNQIKDLRQIYAEFIQEIKEEIYKLENLRADIGKLRKLSVHYSSESTNYNILRDYYSFRAVSDKIHSPENNSMVFRTLANSKLLTSTVQETVRNLFGEIKISVDEDVVLRNVSNRESFLPSIEFFKIGQCFIRDVCYDFERNFLYVLNSSFKQFAIYRLSQDSSLQMLKLNLRNEFCLRISLWPNRKILLQTSDEIKLLSLDADAFADVSLPFYHSRKLLAMCTSPCRKFVYFCCKGYWVCKYNPVNYFSETAAINLPSDCLWMSVSPNLDYIVFTGYFHAVFLFSFNQKQILHVFSNTPSSSYQHGTFISVSIFVVFDSTTSSLIIFSAEEKAFIRRVTHFRSEESKELEDIGKVSSLTAIGSNALFVRVSKTDSNVIYKVSLNF